jgi:predicted Zn-dependent protease
VNENKVDELFGRATVLLGAGRFEEAVEVLRAARDEASAEDDRESEAFFSSIAGSFLASRGQNEEALKEYARAEHCDPSAPVSKVATANHLLNLGQAAKAREKAREILVLGHGTPSYEHVGYSLLGLAELALGDEEKAVKAFTASADPARVSLLPASGRDLRLVEELLSVGAGTELGRVYLRDARFRAQADGDEALEGHIRQIESRFAS